MIDLADAGFRTIDHGIDAGRPGIHEGGRERAEAVYRNPAADRFVAVEQYLPGLIPHGNDRTIVSSSLLGRLGAAVRIDRGDVEFFVCHVEPVRQIIGRQRDGAQAARTEIVDR